MEEDSELRTPVGDRQEEGESEDNGDRWGEDEGDGLGESHSTAERDKEAKGGGKGKGVSGGRFARVNATIAKKPPSPKKPREN